MSASPNHTRPRTTAARTTIARSERTSHPSATGLLGAGGTWHRIRPHNECVRWSMAKAGAKEPIQALLKEGRKFPPPKDFVKKALVKSASIHRDAARDPVRFWEKQAKALRWMKPWRKALEWKLPYAKWFVGGKLNVADNCLDRHVEGPRRNKAAIIWEGEPGDTRVLTYADLHRDVSRFAAALKQHGIKKGDTVTIYMPMIPEVAVAMLACARIGAPHSVVFGGFSPDSLRDRIQDA